jgi:hypothetical protein
MSVMRADVKQVCDMLGVGYVLSPYDTCPWSAYDAEKGVTATGIVSMNSEGNEIEAEIQFLYDKPEAGKPSFERMCLMTCRPITGGMWSAVSLEIKGKDEANSVYEWETKGCAFFAACVQEIKMGFIPDIDAIYEREMKKSEKFNDGRQGTTSKAPKIKPNALLGLKQGRGF